MNDITKGLADRLAVLVRVKAGGVQTEFAAIMGWKKQYLSKLLHGEAIGLAPVLALVEKFPDVEPRWILTGDGCMLRPDEYARYLEPIDQFVPVMTDGERREIAAGVFQYTDADIARWSADLERKNAPQNEVFREAFLVQKLQIVCKSK